MNELLKSRVFLLITVTDLLQFLGIWLRNIAILFFVMEMTNDSPIAVSLMSGIELFPMVVFSFIGGVIADRFHPKRTMLFGDFLSMISFVIMGLLIGNSPWWIILFATLVSSIVSQFSYPSSQKYLKEYLSVDAVDRGIALNQTISSVFTVVGPAVGTFFYYTFGIQTVLFIVVGIYLLSIILLTFLPNRSFVLQKEPLSFTREAKDTIQYIINKPILKLLTVLTLFVGIALGLASTLDIFLVTNRLGLEEVQYQWFAGIAGIGMLLGSVLYVIKAEWFRSLRVVQIISFMLTVTIFLEGWSTYVPLTLALQFIDNAMIGILSAYVMGTFTKETDQLYVGKINGFLGAAWFGAVVIATVCAGSIMHATNIVVVYGISAFFMFVSGCYLFKKIEKDKEVVTEY